MKNRSYMMFGRLLGIVALLVTMVAGGAKAQKALFVGNSYTYVNDLPGMLRSLSQSGGITLNTEMSAPGGHTFMAHTSNATTLSFLGMPGFDFVIFQEQSQRPSFPQSQVQQEVYPYAAQLDSLYHVANPCGQSVFFMTWGRKYGDTQNCQFWQPVCTYEGMQVELRRSYLNMAQQNQAIVAPVGIAWWEAMRRDSLLELYSGDFSHPEVTGTYLAACVFYSTLFRRPSLGLSYRSSLDSSTATFLQAVADDVVFDSLTTWRIGLDDLAVGFSHQDLGSGLVAFTESAANATSWTWDFGDGNQSVMPNPQHSYAFSGSYVVSLTVSDGCDTLSMSDTVSVQLVSVNQGLSGQLKVFPNPAKSEVRLDLPLGAQMVVLKDATGRSVGVWTEQYPIKSWNIQIGNLPSGLYWITTDQVDNGSQKILKLP